MMAGFFKKKMAVVFSEPSPDKLARSIAYGTFLAFSPYLGIQTILIFVFSWMLKLNATVTFAVVYLINNPWTMIPIVILDYLVGAGIARILNLDLARFNPSWMSSFNGWLHAKIGGSLAAWGIGELSFWAYFIGGHVVALLGGIIAYGIAKYVIARMANTDTHERKRDGA